LVLIDRPGHPSWCVARRSPLGRAVGRRAGATKAGTPAASRRSGLAFDDPRHDPVALAWARGILESGTWAEGYAQLVREAGRASWIGRRPGSALAAVECGEAETAPATGPDVSGPARRAEVVAAHDAPVVVE